MVCIDTSCIIDIFRGKESIESLVNTTDQKKEFISIASPSVMELIKGAYLGLNTQKEIDKVKELLMSLEILTLDKISAFIGGKIEAELKQKGEMIQVIDIMIAAIVIKNNEMLLTRNIKHFQRIKDLKIETY